MFNRKTLLAVILTAIAGTAAAQDAPRVYVEDLDLAELTIHQPTSFGVTRNRDFELTEKDRGNMQEMYRTAIEKALLKKNRYSIVSDAAEAHIVVNAELLEIRPLAPKDDIHGRPTNQVYYTEGAGSAKIRFTVSTDAGADVVIENRRDAGRDWGKNDRFHNKQDVKQMFGSWGRYLVKQLNDIES